MINLGNDQTITLAEMITTTQEVVSKKAIVDRQLEQLGDVPQTWADVTKAGELFGDKPTTSFKDGVTSFYDWWRQNQTTAL